MEASCTSDENISLHYLPESSENLDLEYVQVDKNSISLDSNWTIEDNKKTLYDAVKYTFNLHDKSSELDGLVSVDSCILLTCTTASAEKCTLYIKCSPFSNLQFSRLLVVSEARKLEIFVDHGEYFKTVCTNFVEEFDDEFIVYKGVVDFVKPVSSCSINFASVRKSNSMWLYGLKIALTRTSSETMATKVDFSRVYERIKESEFPLSEKASEFLQFLAHSNKSLHNRELSELLKQQLKDNKSFLEAFNAGCSQNMISSNMLHSSVMKRFKQLNILPSENGLELNRSSATKRNSCDTSTESATHSVIPSDWKDYITEIIQKAVVREFEKFEERLWNKLDRRLEELEERQSSLVFKILESFTKNNKHNVLMSDRCETLSDES